MNYGSKKAILMATRILETITLIVMVLTAGIIIGFGFYFYGIIGDTEELDVSKIFLITPAIYLVFYSIYYSFITIYFSKKIRQTKEQFYKTTWFIKVVSILVFFVSPIASIFLMIVAFTKDDNQEEIPIYKREKRVKKQKIKYSSQTKKALKDIKSQKRRGIISQELYNKKRKEIIKKEEQIKKTKD